MNNLTYKTSPMRPFSGINPQNIPSTIPKACRAQYITSKNSS